MYINTKYISICFACLLVFAGKAWGQNKSTCDSLTVMFYNVQNYFDTVNNPLTNDDEFTPLGNLEWTHERYSKKRDDLARVIEAVNPLNPPAIIGLCEIENRMVLEDLTENTPLQKYNYNIIHHDSPDTRGIDVALLYRSEFIVQLESAFSLMGDPALNGDKREILYAKLLINKKDTLHVFVNHFPSKREGVKKTAPKRMEAASALRHKIDSILSVNPNAAIIAIGDFNDTPKSSTVTEGLKAKMNFENTESNQLYCLSAGLARNKEGSVYFSNRWQLVDLFFASGGLLQPQNNLYCNPDNVQIFKPDFLLEYVPKNNDYRPVPTYRWVKYTGGYSDHLPVLLKLYQQ